MNTLVGSYNDSVISDKLDKEESLKLDVETTALSYEKSAKLKSLKNEIELLGENEHVEILKIILTNDEKYTKNKNGYFIVLNKINDKTIEELENYITFNKNNIINKFDLKS